MPSNGTGQGKPQVVFVSIYQGPLWVSIFEPKDHLISGASVSNPDLSESMDGTLMSVAREIATRHAGTRASQHAAIDMSPKACAAAMRSVFVGRQTGTPPFVRGLSFSL